MAGPPSTAKPMCGAPRQQRDRRGRGLPRPDRGGRDHGGVVPRRRAHRQFGARRRLPARRAGLALAARAQRDTEAQVQFLSRHDVLTGALNAANFRDALARACADQSADGPRLAVRCIDLDRFSDVNEAYGRAAGDRLLRLVAERLGGVLRVPTCWPGWRATAMRCCSARSPTASRSRPWRSASSKVWRSPPAGQRREPDRGHRQRRRRHPRRRRRRRRRPAAERRTRPAARPSSTAAPPGVSTTRRWTARWQDRRCLAQDLRDALAHDALQLHFQPVFAGQRPGLIGYEALARCRTRRAAPSRPTSHPAGRGDRADRSARPLGAAPGPAGRRRRGRPRSRWP